MTSCGIPTRVTRLIVYSMQNLWCKTNTSYIQCTTLLVYLYAHMPVTNVKLNSFYNAKLLDFSKAHSSSLFTETHHTTRPQYTECCSHTIMQANTLTCGVPVSGGIDAGGVPLSRANILLQALFFLHQL